MHNELFDIFKLPIIDYPLSGKNYGVLSSNDIIQATPKTHYDHFVTNNNEYIIVNAHSVFAGAEEILNNNGFITIFNTNNKEEPNFIAYRETTLLNTYKRTHNIVMCVMLCERNSISDVVRFIEYYKNQGIEKIFFYFCGKLSGMLAYPNDDLVEYLEWDFLPSYVYVEKSHYKFHYLQVPLYDMFLKKISPFCNYTIFCDLDEYIYCVDKQPLCKYLSNINTHLFAGNVYARINFISKIAEIELSLETYKKNNKPKNYGRGKSIVRGSIIQPTDRAGVHYCKVKNLTEDFNLVSLHNRVTNLSDYTASLNF